LKYVFDSSSVFRAIKENAVEAVAGGFTLELARYELGNILWKEYALRRRASIDEIRRLARIVKEVLGIMEELSIVCHEEEILDMAGALGLTFYDATYVYYAKKNGLPLITEDSDLIEKGRSHIKVLKLQDIIQ
jgi:predicted nucleic acid-binding protein